MIISGTCYSYKKELFQGVHQDSDVYKIALFTKAASLDPSVASYSAQAGEVPVGNGYTTGGAILSGFSVGASGKAAFVDFNDITWISSTITARGALVYNSSKGNRALAVIDFGADFTSTNGPFAVEFPDYDAENAFISLT